MMVTQFLMWNNHVFCIIYFLLEFFIHINNWVMFFEMFWGGRWRLFDYDFVKMWEFINYLDSKLLWKFKLLRNSRKLPKAPLHPQQTPQQKSRKTHNEKEKKEKSRKLSVKHWRDLCKWDSYWFLMIVRKNFLFIKTSQKIGRKKLKDNLNSNRFPPFLFLLEKFCGENEKIKVQILPIRK